MWTTSATLTTSLLLELTKTMRETCGTSTSRTRWLPSRPRPAQFGCGGGTSAAAVNCAIAAGANITSFAANGLDSQRRSGRHLCCRLRLRGLNPAAPAMPFLVPAGISKYNALIKLNYQKNNPFKGMHAINAQVSYSYSSFRTRRRFGYQRHTGRSPTAIRTSLFLRWIMPIPIGTSDLPY